MSLLKLHLSLHSHLRVELGILEHHRELVELLLDHLGGGSHGGVGLLLLLHRHCSLLLHEELLMELLLLESGSDGRYD